MSSSFEGFCNMLGLKNVGPYMNTRQAQKLEDWTSVPLDDEGKCIQEEMTRKFQVMSFVTISDIELNVDRFSSNCPCEAPRPCSLSPRRS